MSTAAVTPDKWEQYAQPASPGADKWDKYAKPAPAKGGPDTPGNPTPSFTDTLGREIKSAGNAVFGAPSAVYHAFADPATKEETAEAPDLYNPIHRGPTRLITKPIATAADWYSDAARGKIPNVYEQMLSAAPEAIGQGAGSVIAGKIAEEAPRVAAPAVRATARGINKVLPKAGPAVGAAVGAGVGHASGIPEGGLIGAVVGREAGKLLPKVRIPGEGFGLPDRVVGGPKIAPPFEFADAGAPLPEHPGTFPGANLPDHPGVFPGATQPTATPEQLNPALVSPSRSLPGQIGKESVGPARIARPTAEPIPPRSGLALPAASDPILDRLRANAARIAREGHGDEIPEEIEATPQTTNLDKDLTPALKASLAKVRAAKRIARPSSPAIQ